MFGQLTALHRDLRHPLFLLTLQVNVFSVKFSKVLVKVKKIFKTRKLRVSLQSAAVLAMYLRKTRHLRRFKLSRSTRGRPLRPVMAPVCMYACLLYNRKGDFNLNQSRASTLLTSSKRTYQFYCRLIRISTKQTNIPCNLRSRPTSFISKHKLSGAFQSCHGDSPHLLPSR